MAMSKIDVAVLAGGLGTRLSGVLSETPKILAPVLGKPFLDHLLEGLVRQGVQRVILCLGHRACDVRKHLELRSFAPLEVVSVVEPEPLGTGGAIAFARSHFHSDPVLIVNGDTLVDVDLNEFLAEHRASHAPASILCAEVEDGGRYGRIQLDSRDFVLKFQEKDASATGPTWINAGYYLFGKAVLDRIVELSKGSLELDILGKMGTGTIHAYRTRGRFLDIGTPDTLRMAPEFLTP
jgi:mannose-1-phosphate guanylyltransferase